MTKEYKYIVLQLNNNEGLNDFFDSYFQQESEQVDKYTIYKLENEKTNRNLENLIDTIKMDFDEDIKIFETNLISTKCKYNFNDLFEIYKKNQKKSYMNISILCTVVLENKEQNKDLDVLKEIVLNPLEDKSLLDISKAMFKNNLNVSKTASDVYMHRNTVINKLDVIESKTGLNIQHFQDAFLMYLFINKKN